MLARGRGLTAGARDALQSDVVLPNVAEGVGQLVADYVSSPLAAFHRAFHAGAGEVAGSGPSLDPASLPPCIAACLVTPNDLLLRPEHLQNLTRALLSRGWPASTIAALVRASYEADHHWGDRWTRMHAQTRAEFEVRVFAGLVATGLDRLVDYNCVSAQEKGMCPGTGCTHDLTIDRDRLLAKGRI